MPERKIAYYTIGAESSGNRMFNHCLASSGVYGDPSLGHDLEDMNFENRPARITLSRSVPHGETIPDPIAEAKRLLAAGYEVVPIHIYRKSDFVIRSQIRRGHAPDEAAALASIDLAVQIAYEFASWLQRPLITVTYGLFVNYRFVREHLFAQLDLPAPTYTLYNANEEYVGEHQFVPF